MKIPQQWRETVCGILTSCDSSRIVITSRARHDWEATFPLSFGFEMYRAMAATLRNESVEGNKVEGMTPPGTVYEFIFAHQGKKMYGKINLMPNGKIIIIYSAHVPLKGDTL